MRLKHLLLVPFFIGLKLIHAQKPVQMAILDKNENIQIGENISISSQFKGLPIVEPHISSHPRDNNHLLVAAMVVTDINNPYQSCRLSSFVSVDGGKNWKETVHDWWGYDPWTAILPNGQAAMSWLGTKGNFQHQFPLQFFSSNDGGLSWTDEVQTVKGQGHGHDGTKIVGLGEEFYANTVRFNGQMGADVVLYRRQEDQLFEEVAVIDGKGVRLNFCEPVVLTDGTVLIPASHFLRKIWIQSYNPKSNNLSQPNTFSINPGGAKGYMRLVADVSFESNYQNRAYFIRAMGSSSTYDGIWLNYSSDKGQTWSEDTRIDLFDQSPGSKALVPSAAVNNRGVLGVSWVDSQNDSNQEKNDVYFTASFDGGDSFVRPVRITSISSNPRTHGNGDVANKFPGGGHYLGMTARPDGSFQLIWSDSRSGVFELQTCNVSVDS